MLDITQILEPVREELALVEAKLRQAMPQEHPVLVTTIDRLLSSGGKRIRPALVMLACRFYPTDTQKAVALAASVEMLHTATLVHDDLIDGALVRRGVPTLNSAWTPSLTILTGDYLFARAAYMAAETNNVRITTIFARTLMTICTGEIRQQLEKPNRSLDAYYERIYAKTAALLMASTEAAGVLSGAPEGHIQALSDYGHYLGMAFQIVDDVLDFTSNEATLGKPVGSDLAQGLATLPTLYYLRQHPSDDIVTKVLDGATDDPEIVDRAVQAVRQSEAIGEALAQAREFAGYSQKALTRLPNGPACESLQALAEFVVQRKV